MQGTCRSAFAARRTDSTLYADKVGKEFASKQPEHEVTAADATELGALGVAPGVGPVYH